MQTDQQTTQQSTEQQVLNPESLPIGYQAEQSASGENIPEGYVFTDSEDLKLFYLHLAMNMFPAIDPNISDNQKLCILYNRINKTCKFFELIANYQLTDFNSMVTKACGFMLMDTLTSAKEKRKLNDWLYMRTQFVGKMAELHDLVTHNRLFFSEVKANLRKILHMDVADDKVNLK